MSINKVILLGYTGKDPEVKDVAGTKVANLSLATTEKGYTLQNGIQVPDRTEWHSLIFWKGLAEVVEKYVRKGSQIYIEGKIKTRQYEDRTGSKRYVTEIFVLILFLTHIRMPTVQIRIYDSNILSFANSPPLASSNFCSRSATLSFFFSSPFN